MQNGVIYHIVSGAGTARRAPELLRALAVLGQRLLVVPTPNAGAVVSSRELALALDGAGGDHRVVESYFDTAILPRPKPGLVLVAPCSFASLNKLAQGIADNLAVSIVSEAIGGGWPVVVAPSMNAALWGHPAARRSVDTLREWGVTVVEPAAEDGQPRLAATEAVVAAVQRRLTVG